MSATFIFLSIWALVCLGLWVRARMLMRAAHRKGFEQGQALGYKRGRRDERLILEQEGWLK